MMPSAVIQTGFTISLEKLMDPYLFFTLTDPVWSKFWTAMAICFVVFTIIVVAVCMYNDDDYRGHK